MNIKLTEEEWDAKNEKIVNHPQAIELNLMINQRKSEYELQLIRRSGSLCYTTLTATQLRNQLIEELHPEIIEARKAKEAKSKESQQSIKLWFDRFMNHKTGGTLQVYQSTYHRLQAYLGREFEIIKFNDINKEWLVRFDEFLSITAKSANARASYMKSLRAVFNYAIDNEVTTNYPFRRFKIKNVPTRKRNLRVDALRKLFNAKGLLPRHEYHRDMFKLSFMLIGINNKDLFNLRTISNGRLDYMRAKTHKPYSIKVEPEAMEIINRYLGDGDRLLEFRSKAKNINIFTFTENQNLKEICNLLNQQDDGIVLPAISTYWARHSWATIASYLDIPKDVIAAGLGHSNNTVTDIYIEFDQRKVDAANRKVLDYVLYDKR